MISFKEFLSLYQLNEKLITFGGKAYPKFGQVVILAGGAGCFNGDTLVKTETGDKRISEIKNGDKVLSFNENTKEYEYQSVIDLYRYNGESKKMVEIEFEDGEKVICTEDHEFLIDDNWIMAKDLI